jgi:hypothetical protein
VANVHSMCIFNVVDQLRVESIMPICEKQTEQKFAVSAFVLVTTVIRRLTTISRSFRVSVSACIAFACTHVYFIIHTCIHML